MKVVVAKRSRLGRARVRINFGDTFADAAITTAHGQTTVSFADGQVVTMNGTHDPATIACDPSIHYI
jgi:hypothetical protein